MARVNFRQAEVVRAVMRAGSLTEAARLLNVSQPAISMMLKSAEEHSGLKLFERTAGSIRPSPEARYLAPWIESVFAELQEFERQLLKVREGQAGMLTIAATPTLATAFVCEAAADFNATYPEVRVVIRSVATESVVDLVARRQADLGMVYAPAGDDEVEAEDLGISEVACVLKSDHHLAKRSIITPDDLKGSAIISYRPETPLGQQIARTFRAASVDLEISIQTSSINAAHLANKGVGLALIDPFVLFGGMFEGCVVRPFRPTAAVRVQLLTARGHLLAGIARSFRCIIEERIPARYAPPASGEPS